MTPNPTRAPARWLSAWHDLAPPLRGRGRPRALRPDDQGLIDRMLCGEERAYQEFFEAYAPRLAAFAARRAEHPAATIEDVVQNTLIKAIRKLGSFRCESALYTWLCQICQFELIDLHRKATRREEHDRLDVAAGDTNLRRLRDEAADPVRILELREQRGAIANTLACLPKHYARVLAWKYEDGFSVEEVARMLGLTAVAAQSLLQRARLGFKESWVRQSAL